MEAIELLGRIERVEPPPFLYTRIMARVQDAPVPARWLVTAGLACAVLVSLNIAVLRHRAGEADITELAGGLGLNTSNQLYR